MLLHSGTKNYPNPDSLIAKPSEAVTICKDVFSSIKLTAIFVSQIWFLWKSAHIIEQEANRIVKKLLIKINCLC